MTFYCFWECRKIDAVFLTDSADIVEKCPFHPNDPPEIYEDTGEPYANHFEDAHVRRVWSSEILRRLQP